MSSAIFEIFGMTWSGIEPRSPGPLTNTLPNEPVYILNHIWPELFNLSLLHKRWIIIYVKKTLSNYQVAP